MAEIPYSDFERLELRVGQIISAEDLVDSEKLVRLQVDFGDEKRQAIAGIKKHFTPENLVGKKFVFVTNLEKRKIMGEESQCMVLAATDDEGKMALLEPSEDVKIGARIR